MALVYPEDFPVILYWNWTLLPWMSQEDLFHVLLDLDYIDFKVSIKKRLQQNVCNNNNNNKYKIFIYLFVWYLIQLSNRNIYD